MFECLTREKVFETVDVDKKNQVIQMFNEKGIDCLVRRVDAHHRSAIDTMKMGEMMIKPKYVYVFWVKKKQSDDALSIVKTL